MIITISGPSSTGKTTLLNNLKEYKSIIESITQKSVVFKQEGIREVVKEYYKETSLKDIFKDKEESLKLQFKIAEYNKCIYSRMIGDKSSLYIYDRGPLDNLIYTILCYNSCDNDVMSKYSSSLSKYCSLSRALSKYVNIIFLTKTDNMIDKPEDDGFRPELFSTLRRVEVELFNSIFESNPSVIVLPSDHNERLSVFLSNLYSI